MPGPTPPRSSCASKHSAGFPPATLTARYPAGASSRRASPYTRGGRRGHNRSGRRKGQHFEDQGRTADHLAPAAFVGAFGNPLAPEFNGIPHNIADFFFLEEFAAGAVILDPMQHKANTLTAVQGK